MQISEIINKKSPNFSHVQYSGLQNQGATCYMNSMLQALYHLPIFRQAIYKLDYSNASDEKNIPLNMQKLFAEMELNPSNRPVSTKALTTSFGWTQDETWRQHDAQEFLRVIIDNLETKMKTCKELENFIPSLFQGEYKSFVKCLNVDYSSSVNQTFYDISLNVHGISSVQESLKKYIEVEKLNDLYETEKYGKQEAVMGIEFLKFPPVLHLHLRRFEYDSITNSMKKINSKFEFPPYLNLSKFKKNCADDEEEDIYELFGVLVHRGSSYYGHYYAYLRPTKENTWYCFNDSSVIQVKPNQVFEDNFGGTDNFNFTKTHSAYMLIYIKRSEIPKYYDIDTINDIPEATKHYILNEESEVENSASENNYIELKIITPQELEICVNYDNKDDNNIKLGLMPIKNASFKTIQIDPDQTMYNLYRKIKHSFFQNQKIGICTFKNTGSSGYTFSEFIHPDVYSKVSDFFNEDSYLYVNKIDYKIPQFLNQVNYSNNCTEYSEEENEEEMEIETQDFSSNKCVIPLIEDGYFIFVYVYSREIPNSPLFFWGNLTVQPSLVVNVLVQSFKKSFKIDNRCKISIITQNFPAGKEITIDDRFKDINIENGSMIFIQCEDINTDSKIFSLDNFIIPKIAYKIQNYTVSNNRNYNETDQNDDDVYNYIQEVQPYDTVQEYFSKAIITEEVSVIYKTTLKKFKFPARELFNTFNIFVKKIFKIDKMNTVVFYIGNTNNILKYNALSCFGNVIHSNQDQILFAFDFNGIIYETFSSLIHIPLYINKSKYFCYSNLAPYEHIFLPSDSTIQTLEKHIQMITNKSYKIQILDLKEQCLRTYDEEQSINSIYNSNFAKEIIFLAQKEPANNNENDYQDNFQLITVYIPEETFNELKYFSNNKKYGAKKGVKCSHKKALKHNKRYNYENNQNRDSGPVFFQLQIDENRMFEDIKNQIIKMLHFDRNKMLNVKFELCQSSNTYLPKHSLNDNDVVYNLIQESHYDKLCITINNPQNYGKKSPRIFSPYHSNIQNNNLSHSSSNDGAIHIRN